MLDMVGKAAAVLEWVSQAQKQQARCIRLAAFC